MAKLENITLSEVTYTWQDKFLLYVGPSSESLDVSI